MVAPRLALSVLAVGLGSVQGWAQEGPSFDCRYARTATEVAICADPVLARAELRMVGAYQSLVDAIGERPARRLADRLLERRQACEGQADCIARRLANAEAVFERRAVRALRLDPSPAAPDRLAAVPRPPVRPGAPLARGVAPTSEEIAALFATAETVSSDVAAVEPTGPAATPASAGPAPFDSPAAWAFMDLVRHQRAEIQTRLAEAGLHDGPAEGSWDQATLASIQAFAATPQGQGFDLSTQTGAKLALDYIRSDAYAQSLADPLAEADW